MQMTTSPCENCHSPLDATDKFCINCGSSALSASGPPTERLFALAIGYGIEKGTGTEPSEGRYLEVQNGRLSGTRFALEPGMTRIGRDPGKCNVLLDDVSVSRHHADLTTVEAKCTIVDAKSMNGTYVNGRRVDRLELRHNDLLQVGLFRLLYTQS